MAYILPVSALRQPYTSPKPPRPMMRCTEKSFMLRVMFSSRFFHWQNRVNWERGRRGSLHGTHSRRLENIRNEVTFNCCGSAFILSGSRSSILGWIPIRIRIQSGSRAIEKKLQPKKNFFFESKTTIYLSLSLHKERSSYRRSLQLSKEAIQHFKTWTFKFFSTYVGHFCPPGSGSNPDPDTDPDPQPWWFKMLYLSGGRC